MKRKPSSAKPTLTSPSANAVPHFIGYLRVSKDRDTTGSFTFETQEQRIREKLERIYGAGNYQLTLLQDDGLSGAYGLSPTGVQPKVRPNLQKIAELLKTDEYAGLIVYSLSRLGRNVRLVYELVQDVLTPHGKVLLSATEEIDILNPDSLMLMYVNATVQEKQRADIVKRNKDAAASRAEQGYAIGQVGYGWVWDPNQTSGSGRRRGIVSVEEEKHWLIHIKDRYLSGWNGPKIAGELNDLSVASPLQRALWSSKGKKQRTRDGREPKWTSGTVWNVLCNPHHAGLIRCPDGRRIQAQHWEQRFWDPEILEQIEQTHEQRNKRFKTCTGQKSTPHLLNGLIFCARCGHRLYMSSTSQTTKAYRAYKCTNGVKEGQPTCREVVVRAQWAEDAVVEVIAALSQEPGMRRMLEDEVKAGAGKQDENLKVERTQVKNKLDSLQERFERWAEGYSKNVMTDEQFQIISRKMAVEQTETEQKLYEIEAALENRMGREMWLGQVREQLETFSLAWKELDNDEKRQVLSLLIEDNGLSVDREGRDIRLKVKVHLLPERETVLIYRTYRGVSRTTATGLQRLTLRQMVLLHYAGQGKSRKECAELTGCKVPSIHTLEKTIRKNLGGVSWPEAVEMARERVEANLSQLPLGQTGKGQAVGAGSENGSAAAFLSPVLREVFELFAIGATVPEVAERLHLSVTTVQGRRARILKQFGTSSMLEAVEKAKKSGVL